MGKSRKTHGGAMLVEKQAQFVLLIAQGVSNAEACRIVGVNRKTGTRWRYGRTVRNRAGQAVHYPPVRTLPPAQRHPRYLSAQERTVIADLLGEKKTLRQIGVELGRAPSTISREIRRNCDETRRYRPQLADRAAGTRIRRPRRRKVDLDAELAAVVRELLGKRWSPEQVAHELRVRFPDQPHRWLCAETIY